MAILPPCCGRYWRRRYFERHRLGRAYMKVRSLARRELHWALRSRQALITGFAMSLLVNGAQGWTLAAIMPTVRLVPVVVNARADGTATAEPIMSMMPPDVQNAVLRSTLWQYVVFREGYSFDTAEMRSKIVRELSNREVGQAYSDWCSYQILIARRSNTGRRAS